MDDRKLHQAWFALGTNLGDRTRNLSDALNELMRHVKIQKASPRYETEPWGIIDQPRFLNLCCSGTTSLEPRELLAFLKDIEQRLGRVPAVRNGPRVIDIDILFYDSLILNDEDLTIPHPRLHERAFVLVPLADIAPDLVHPVLGKTIANMTSVIDKHGVVPMAQQLARDLPRDVQEESPSTALALQRVGITGLKRAIRLPERRHPLIFHAEFDLFIDLPARQKGAHMSRFSQAVEHSLDEWAQGTAPDVETLAERVAHQVMERLSAARAEVHLRAQLPLLRWTPITSNPSQEMYALLGIAAATPKHSVRLVGVEAEGMTACPCAQDMVREYSRNRLTEAGFTDEQAERALQVIPLVSHNQRGRGTLIMTAHPTVRAEDLIRIVESAMSSEIYDLLKRPDELFVTLRAHEHPRFVEDVVREMLDRSVSFHANLPDDTFVLARQINFESIHKHSVFAERSATLGNLRRELAGESIRSNLSLSAWLDTQLT